MIKRSHYSGVTFLSTTQAFDIGKPLSNKLKFKPDKVLQNLQHCFHSARTTP